MLSKYGWIGLCGFFLLTVGLSACSSGGSEPTPVTATVNGRLLDSSDTPIIGAFVTSDSIEIRTDAEGRFSLATEAGACHLEVSKDGITLLELCMTAAEGVIYDLGDIHPGMENTCGPGTPTVGDADGDGLQDTDEISGWTVNITLGDGTIESRKVDSDSGLYDTDGDGLNDTQEMAARTDPRRMDTDGDLLSDYAELYIYKSQPNKMDSDGDSCDPDSAEGTCDSDPNLWDGYELSLSNTSPTLADSDGDGLSDYQEINVGGTNPLVADLPDLSLELNGDPSIILNITDTSNSSNTEVSSSLRSDTAEQKKNSKASTDLTVKNTTHIHAEAEAGTGKWPPSASVKATNDTDITAAYSFHTDTSFSKNSVQETKDSYVAQVGNAATVSFNDGMLWVAIKLKNHSSLAFKLKDLKVIAYRMEPGGSFSTVGTLVPGSKSSKEVSNPVDTDQTITRGVWVKELLCADPENSATCGRVLGPSDELTLVVGADALPAQIMRAMVENPTALRFEVASYSLFQLDDMGVNETVNYAKVNEGVLQRCGLLSVDYGDGTVLNKMVAANVYRNPDGSGRGVAMHEALSNILALDYETLRQPDTDTRPGNEVLYRVKSLRAYDKCDSNSADYDATEDCVTLHKMGLWMVGGSDKQFDENAPTIDFDNLLLKNDEQINLVYLQDSDGEGIFDREEYLLGTDRTVPDSDYDGFSDYDESRTGWMVAVDGTRPYAVFSDPRFADIDADLLSDNTESFLGTDPYKRDTDGDGQDDTTDPFPLSPPCLAGDKLGMVAWWDGEFSQSTNYFADDVWSGTDSDGIERGIASDGLMFPLEPEPKNLVLNLREDQVFQFNPGADQNTQYLEVANQGSDGLSPYRELTFSAEIYWEGVATGKEWATVLSKGNLDKATYALSINPEGRLKFSLYRNARVYCWLDFFGGWNDDFCADFNQNDTEELTTDIDHVIGKQKWVKVTGTFIGETLSLYLDGVLAASIHTDTSYRYDGSYRYKDAYTRYLVANSDPLRIGGEFSGTGIDPIWPFRGLMDDVQVFGKGLNTDEVSQMSKIGVCSP